MRSAYFMAENPATLEQLPGEFPESDIEAIHNVVAAAQAAFPVYAATTPGERGAFLRAIAESLEARAEDIITRAHLETALPKERLTGEMARTAGQLRFFAQIVEEGSWIDARIDTALPERKPMPRPDIRSCLSPLGPVAVFGASNFPLAFSVAGGDTASALAAGNPVVVKAHPAHPGTSALVAEAVAHAVKHSALPEGVFSLLSGKTHSVGESLVKHPGIRAVGFTGSRPGGLALTAIAAARKEPIPVYSEMSSVNPLFILNEALKDGTEDLARQLHASATLGAGQFCTNPGIVIIPKGTAGDSFAKEFCKRMAATPAACMLHRGIRKAYCDSLALRSGVAGVEARVFPAQPDHACHALPSVFLCSDRTFLNEPALAEEIFGPSTLLVTVPDDKSMIPVARSFRGELTAGIFCPEDALSRYQDLANSLQEKTGRLLFNQFPTGVEVCQAMVHGGPYPATSDGRSTSVGGRALLRFVRPVCWQNSPDALLPDALKDENPLGITRLVNGEMKRANHKLFHENPASHS